MLICAMLSAADYNRQGVLAKQSSDFEAAERCYRQAILTDSRCAEAHYNWGVLCQDVGRVEEAIAHLENALRLRPDVELICQRLVTACVQSANAFQQRGKLAAAQQAYRRALEWDPNSGAALTNLSQIHRQQGDLTHALELAQRAVEATPSLWEAHVSLGNVQAELAELDSAITSYRQAVTLRPDRHEAHTYLAETLARRGHLEEAATEYQAAIQVDGTAPRPARGLGDLHVRMGQFDEATTFYQLASSLDPTDPVSRLRAAAVCPLVFSSTTAISELRARILEVARDCAEAQLGTSPATVAATFEPAPFNLQFLDGDLLELKQAVARVYSWYFEVGPGRHLHGGATSRRATPRVAFVVTRSHEKGFVRSMAHVVRHLSRVGFDVSVVCSATGAEVVQQPFADTNVCIVMLEERFDLAAAAIRRHEFDLIYYWEVGTDPTNYFLPFLRLAPIQCTSWGTQVTSGIPHMDFYLSTKSMEVENAAKNYSEQLVVADDLLVMPLPDDAPNTNRAAARERLGWKPNTHLYGCIQNPGKIHPEFDDVFGNILRSDSEGQILLSADSRSQLRARLEETIPDVVDRIRFLPSLDRPQYSIVLQACDVSLDPIHFSGMNTTLDALAAGCPIVTRPTDQQRSRFAAACLHQLDLPQLVARDLDDYVEIAVSVATDTRQAGELRAAIEHGSGAFLASDSACMAHERIFHELLTRFR